MPIVSKPTAEIVQARHEGEMFGFMSQKQLLLSAGIAIGDLKILTGLKIPTAEGFERMKQMLAKTLFTDYPTLTMPLLAIGLNQFCHVLTTGDNKSYGRDLSIADIKQVIDAHLPQLQNADDEVGQILDRQVEEKILTESEKQNKIRHSIETRYQADDVGSCNYVDFEQLLRDGYFTEKALFNRGWHGLQSVKEKYQALLESIPGSAEPKNIKGNTGRRKFQDKLAMLNEIENEVKGEVANQFMKDRKAKNVAIIYQPE